MVKNIRIAEKIIIRVLPIFVFSLILIIAVELHDRLSSSHKQEISKVEMVIKTLEISTTNDYLAHDFGALQEYAKKFLRWKEVKYLYFQDRQGKVIGSSNPEMIGKTISNPSILKLSLQNKEYDVFDRPNHTYEGIIKVTSGDTLLGFIVAGFDHSWVYSAIVKFSVLIVFLGIVFVLFLAYTVYLFINRLVTLPLNKIVEGFCAISQGNFDYDLKVDSEDEIGRLSGGFVQMAKILKNSCKDMEAYNSELEARVQERTQRIVDTTTMLNAVTDNVTEGLMLIDKDCNVHWVNKKAVELSKGKDERELIGLKCHQLSHHFDRPCNEMGEDCPLFDATDMHKPTSLLHRHLGADNEVSYVQVSVVPLFDEKGNIWMYLHEALDVTDRVKVENSVKDAFEKLQATQSQLVQSAKMAALGQLAGGVAHEINNPLTGVLNNIQLIKMEMDDKGCDPQTFKEILDVVEEAAMRCKRITTGLLDFSRSDKKSYQPTDLSMVVKKTIDLAGHDMKLDNIKIVSEFASNLPPILADANQLQQIFLNLINNARWAVKAKPDATISVKTYASSFDKTVNIEISDNGCGIDKEHLKRLFEPFFTTKKPGEGTGLGLSICYGIIKEHRGTVMVNSEVGLGTTFKITFPQV